jgi:hypothetical protein
MDEADTPTYTSLPGETAIEIISLFFKESHLKLIPKNK